MTSGIRLIDHLVAHELEADSVEQALEKIAQWGDGAGLFKSTWLKAAIKRESEFPTGLPTLIPVAIPHTDSVHVNADGVGFFKLNNPIEFGEMGSLDEKVQVKMILPLLITNPAEQVDLLMAVIGALQDAEFLSALDSASSTEEIISIFRGAGL
ncbi:MAG: PTS sugar transporter subunit IIA [Streptomycetaceae bacterium]|jgi:PTS system galactitol-specific IIA component|nr:MAG: PTS sugar transporter subunit IIA [Streptomycetaceae bacterium]